MSTNYRLPQVEVFQDIVGTSTTSVRPLRPLILGGHAQLVRFAEAAEREDGYLGYYDDAVDTPYAWPTRPAGGVVNQDSVRLYALDGLLEYWASSIDSGPAVRKVASYRNRVRADSLDFATHGAYDRHASLGDRDVTVGDIARVRYVGDAGAATLWTYVRELLGDAVAAVVGAGAKASTNAATQLLSTAISQTAGDINTVAASASGAAYNGLASGHISETYTIVVLDGSSGGDFSTARLRIISASGTDDVAEVSPAVAGQPTTIGSRGLTVTFSLDHLSSHSDSAEAAGVSPIDLLTGQRWTVTVNQAFTAPNPTSGGTYSGLSDTTYVVTVVRGGTWATSPQIQVTTVTGSDVSGPTAVTAAATAVAVGTKNVTIAFSGTALRTGDIYYIPVTAATTGHVRTLVLGHNLPSGVSDNELVGVTLYAKRTVEIPKNREGYAPLVNWTSSATQITTKSGIVIYDPEFTDGGVPRPLELRADATAGYGKLYAEYHVWLQDLTAGVITVAPEDPLDIAITGVLDPGNPLKYAVAKARANAARPDATGDLAIKALAVSDPGSLDSWQSALDILAGADGFYRIVPLTKDPAVLALVHAHVESFSTPDEALWRTAMFSLPALPRAPLVHAGSTIPGHLEATTEDGEVALWVLEDDAQTTGTQYTIARCTTGNARAVTNHVRGGDVFRSGYATDGFGNETYDEYIIDAVLSEDELRLVAGASGPISVPMRGEVWRDLDPNGEADAVARIAGAYNSSRVCAVWPDRAEADGQIVEGYFLCAALAGLTGAVLPHQGVTRMEVKGFTAVPRTTARFNRPQLNRMAGSGVWIVTQDASTGMIFNRHAITTAPYDQVALREEMRQRNRDSVSYRARDFFAPYIGVKNAVESVDERIRLDFKIWRDQMMHELETTDLGGQLTDAVLRRLGPYAALPDTRVLVIECFEPSPLNNFYIHLVITG